MEVILEQGGATHSSKPFAANLRWFFGVVAVGTTHGHLYLIDLRLVSIAIILINLILLFLLCFNYTCNIVL